jgi:hypothetical protein
MKLSEIIEQIDTSHAPYYPSELAEEILGYYPTACLAEHGFTERYISTWLCTDTTVGTSIIYRDNNPICISVQKFRKSDPTFYWLSKEIYNETAAFIRSLEDKENEDDFKVADLNDDWPETYDIEFTGQLLRSVHNKAFYQSQLFDVDWDSTRKINRSNYIAQEVALVIDNEMKVVPLAEVTFPIKLKEASC